MDDWGKPNPVLRVRRFSGFHRVGFSLFAVVLWGEREHATPAGSRDVEFSLRVNSSLGHRCGGDNNVTDPYVVQGEFVGLWLGWFPVWRLVAENLVGLTQGPK